MVNGEKEVTGIGTLKSICGGLSVTVKNIYNFPFKNLNNMD
jgi:hypothetical protein